MVEVPDSSQIGYLQPTTPPPFEDAALDNLLQGVVAGVTNLPGNMVRPRWQLVPPKQPDFGVNWASIGVINETEVSGNVTMDVHVGDGNGYGITQSTVEMEVLASFYGPNARGNARLFSDGIMIEQNRDQLNLNGMDLKSKPGPLTMLPQLVNEKWLKRVDVPFTIVMAVTRNWPILNILRAQGTIVASADGIILDEPFDTAANLKE